MAWSELIESRAITDVVSLAQRSIEQGWMEGRPERFEKVLGNRTWGLFRVRR